MQEIKQPTIQSNKIDKKFDMYFHTALRNVGLYTSVSFAALAYSRVHRGNTPLYDAVLIIVSLVILLLSFTINYVLNKDIKQHLEQSEESEKEKLHLSITHAIFGVHGVLLVLGLGTFARLYILK
jgi:hypothetical protein